MIFKCFLINLQNISQLLWLIIRVFCLIIYKSYNVLHFKYIVRITVRFITRVIYARLSPILSSIIDLWIYWKNLYKSIFRTTYGPRLKETIIILGLRPIRTRETMFSRWTMPAVAKTMSEKWCACGVMWCENRSLEFRVEKKILKDRGESWIAWQFFFGACQVSLR